jgi:hypothetical protein
LFALVVFTQRRRGGTLFGNPQAGRSGGKAHV